MDNKFKINSIEDLGPFLSSRDNSINNIYFSDIPEICKTEPCFLGVDEAGRGPVLGPMVYGIAFCPIEKNQLLIDLKCADSKQINEENRDYIFNEITTKYNENIGWAIDVISPNFISSNMLKRSKYSLNEVSMDSAINLIKQAMKLGANIAEIYVDTVGPPEKYQTKLSQIFPHCIVTVAKKADSIYPIVSAASICAKVSRDHALKVWNFKEEIELTEKGFGSGYPGDPVTKTFLQENIDQVFGFPRLVRFSWATSSNILEKKAFYMEFDEDEEDIKKDKNLLPITSFFNKDKVTGARKRRHNFFQNRFLNNVQKF